MLVKREPCELLLRLAWPGNAGSEATEGLLCIDAVGNVTGANAAARQMLHQPLPRSEHALNFNDLFALPLHMMFDAARRGDAVLEAPLGRACGCRFGPSAAAAAPRRPQTFPTTGRGCATWKRR